MATRARLAAREELMDVLKALVDQGRGAPRASARSARPASGHEIRFCPGQNCTGGRCDWQWAGNDAMVLCTPKVLPKHRCAGHCALGA